MNKYQIIKKLGRGAAGDVFLGKNKSTGEQVALKEISTTVERPQITAETMKEVELMKSLVHPNVVGYIDSFKDSGKLYIAMEYVDGGDLSKFIEDRNGRLLSEEDVLKIFIQIVIGLKYIHDRKVVHRDLKPQNIFMTRVGVVKLGDFGVSKELTCTQDLCQTQIGTPYYLSPEVWNNEPYNTQTDIWAAGCILYELCTLKRPFGGQNINQLLVNVIQGKFQPLTSRFSSDLRDLVSSMLSQNPSERPTASEILAMPFITSRLCSMIRENESQLKTVNIIEHKTKKRKRKVASPKKGTKKPAKKQNEPELIGADTALPLPEEDLPKWAQRILDGGQQLSDSGTLVPEDEDKSDSDWNEWDELEILLS